MNCTKTMKINMILDWFKNYYAVIITVSFSKAAPIVASILSAGILGRFLNNLLLMDVSAIKTDVFLIVLIFALNIILLPILDFLGNLSNFKTSVRYHEKKVSKSLDKDYIKSNAMSAGARTSRWEVNLLLFYTEMLEIFSSVTTIIISLCFMIPVLITNTTLGVICVLVCVPISLFDITSSKKQALLFNESLQYDELRRNDELNIIQGHGFIKNNNIVNQFISTVNKRFTDYLIKTKYRNILLKTMLDIGGSFLTYIAILILLAAGGYMFLQNSVTAGEILIYMGLLPSVSGIIKLCSSLFVGSKKINVLLEKVSYFFSDFENVSGYCIESINNVRANNLNFSYNDIPLIQGIHLNIKNGSKLRITGENGTGKTTLANIIAGIISGADIYVNDTHYKSCDLNTLRDEICYVDQDSYFFSGTIYDNLSIVTKGNQCEHEISYYLNLFSLDKDISYKLLPGATNLSGGEKQKLSIIRGLIKKASVYIFDEPLNNLDDKTTEVFCNEINKLKASCIIISHDEVNIQFNDNIQISKCL